MKRRINGCVRYLTHGWIKLIIVNSREKIHFKFPLQIESSFRCSEARSQPWHRFAQIAQTAQGNQV